jgi:hypothetical protein
VPIGWLTFAVVDVRGDKIARIRVFLSREEALEAVNGPSGSGGYRSNS